MDEFFTLLLDKIENHLKGTYDENLIKYFFEGKISDDLIFKNNCRHHKKKMFLFIQFNYKLIITFHLIFQIILMMKN